MDVVDIRNDRRTLKFNGAKSVVLYLGVALDLHVCGVLLAWMSRQYEILVVNGEIIDVGVVLLCKLEKHGIWMCVCVALANISGIVFQCDGCELYIWMRFPAFVRPRDIDNESINVYVCIAFCQKKSVRIVVPTTSRTKM